MDVTPPDQMVAQPAARPHRGFIQTVLPLVSGLAMTAVFYAVVIPVNVDSLNRYFLGHPVAVAATTLFLIAVAILAFRMRAISAQKNQLRWLRDEDLVPAESLAEAGRPSERWRQQHDAGHVARIWAATLDQLPSATRSGLVVARLRELLVRQSNRGTTKHLGDDLRELSNRDGDSAYDSLGLVRIIIWAIPMLGFLGTVIGITQTLGGLDFSDGTAAVDRLKSGLYVAFDTTAIGLVLSVVAIFLQFPVERSEQALLAEVDARVRDLISSVLPADDPADNQTTLITQLCEGIRVAVAESLATQATIWQATITEAQSAWRTQHTEGTEQFRRLLSTTLTPSLTDHADRLDQSVMRLENVAVGVVQSLKNHSKTWQTSLDQTTAEVQTHRRTLLTHTEAMTELASQQILRHQSSDHEVMTDATTETMTDAMRTLARAVDVLSHRLPASPVQSPASKPTTYGRAA